MTLKLCAGVASVFGSLWTFGESQLAVNDERRCLKLTVRSRCSRCGPSWYDEPACTELRQPESRWTPEKWNIDKGDSFGLTRQIWGILGKSILLLTFFENASLEFSVQKSCFQRWNIDKRAKDSLLSWSVTLPFELMKTTKIEIHLGGFMDKNKHHLVCNGSWNFWSWVRHLLDG